MSKVCLQFVLYVLNSGYVAQLIREQRFGKTEDRKTYFSSELILKSESDRFFVL